MGKDAPGFLVDLKYYFYGKQSFMSAVTATKYITEDEYLVAEEVALEKHEYYKGEVFAMAGASFAHEDVTGNFYRTVGNFLEDKSCRIFLSNVRIQIEEYSLFTYPDLSIFCEKINFYKDRNDTATNPTVLIEVLSPSTQNYDRGDKFSLYRDLPSLKEYILISSTQVLVEHYLKQADNKWQLTVYKSKNNKITIQSINFTIEIEKLYRNVNFEA